MFVELTAIITIVEAIALLIGLARRRYLKVEWTRWQIACFSVCVVGLLVAYNGYAWTWFPGEVLQLAKVLLYGMMLVVVWSGGKAMTKPAST
ncbi:MAG: hypothetical protein R3C02_17745 [Planctomycetaceae bacterium]